MTMNQTQAGRCLTLAHFLRSLPKEQLRQDAWARTENFEMAGKITHMEKPECGTSACAGGWASFIWPDKFRIVYERSPGVGGRVLGCLEFNHNADWSNVGIFWSLAAWFGLSFMESQKVFGPHPSTPERKAKQIEAIVKRNGYEYA